MTIAQLLESYGVPYYMKIDIEAWDMVVLQQLVEVDARPSDAIALALRCHAPIRVAESVFREAHALDFREGEDQEARLREWLESLTPEQLGKYKM